MDPDRGAWYRGAGGGARGGSPHRPARAGQRTAKRGRQKLLEVPDYKFQALRTNLPLTVSALEVWRRYNGRADIENRIKELGTQFGLKGLCCRSFWATEAACHLAICAYNLCVGLQRRLGQPVRAELCTLRWRLFACAAVFSDSAGSKPTLKLAVATANGRRWWLTLGQRFAEHEPNCDAVAASPLEPVPTNLSCLQLRESG